ncbi:MAG: hypothetical protein VX845_00545 [Candidatus Thermoplasmatota archaeon]|nr:hypothetical protein [Candidatus Thermoplasmatota archaeon]
MELIIDACGWAAAVDAKVNLDHALLPLVGRPTWLVPIGVREELDALDRQRRGLLLSLLDERAALINDHRDRPHTDDHIVALATERQAATLTVDRALKGRLIQAGCPIIEVVDGHRLRRIDP